MALSLVESLIRMSNGESNVDAEFDAMRAIYAALKDLEPDAQQRVLDYVTDRLSLVRETRDERAGSSFSPRELAEEVHQKTGEVGGEADKDGDGDFDGVSPVAKKWARRNGLTFDQLSKLFSLGIDEIELVAKSVPGSSKRERMHSVLLLSGAASYLGSGAARVAYDKLKETLGHYNAYDSANFATYIKGFAPEVGGSKDSGYVLTARGLAAAAELIKQAVGAKE
jgi:hypothetical protein